MLIAQLSDLHVDAADSANTRRVRSALAALAQVRPQPRLVLVTGDLTQHGRPQQYELLRNLLGDCGPCALVPGNHDDATLLHRLFPDVSPPRGGMLRLEVEGLRLLLADSCVARQDHGELGKNLLQSMALELDCDPRPTLLAMHHPPVPAHVPAMEGMGMRQVAAFQEWVARRACIIAILAGHYHQAQFATLPAGCPVIVAPSVAPPLVADFTAPSFQVEAKAPAGLLHLWKQRRLSSHFFICDLPAANPLQK
ncbi:3',5'-cyclic adenosine monophosphate phosphodiesterase CpdA [Variovorax sp. PBL-H6]|uniref:metallophosphoesterase n=1 Tax=Variovorax sp. PBL-H6 TaxID=434009 RepID=UPI0013176BEE|nr:metallophosphoesterase [Variovorax sp. PBL-H6]VTU34560.1 3',5'-cyclic adenosine monophosphate phosphodiesterase CpdA [Variovorax sp. PBL-H6]